MKQVIQSARSGALEYAEVPEPALRAGCLRVRNAFSVVSPGTERLMMDFAKKSLLSKAKARPDLVRQVVRKLRNDGPLATYRTVTSRLDSPQPLGYSCAGIVEAVGEGVEGYVPGDRVACAGAGYANHAEIVVVPENLVCPVPEGVELEHAAFATIGSIALQGVRIAAPSLGEVVAVIGLGLIGQLTVQLLRANGCRVLGLDVSPDRVAAAKALGADWAYAVNALPENWKDLATQGYGADFALVTASTTTSEPVELAAQLCRHKGRVVLVGMTAMDLDRRTFYDKELELRMSTSYGPGRYDRRYEELGLDYPLPYVRWTENRNMQSFLSLVESGSVDPFRLSVETVAFDQAEQAYAGLAEGKGGLAVVFAYDSARSETSRVQAVAPREPVPGKVGVSLVGAGNYAKAVLLPALRGMSEVDLRTVVASTGPSALRTAEQQGFANCGTDVEAALGEDTKLVVVATRHDSHAEIASQALRAGKAVWLEKPLAIHPTGLFQVAESMRETAGFLTVGFNRRFSTHATRIRDFFAERSGPLAIHYVMAAGATPTGTWLVDPNEGGGRIIGEACHLVDLCSYLVGSLPETVYAQSVSRDRSLDDSTVMMLRYPDGSVTTIEYLARAQQDLPKERFEVSGDGKTARCENYRLTTMTGQKPWKTFNQDKGQERELETVIAALKEGMPAPFHFDELLSTTWATFAIEAAIRLGEPIDLARYAESGYEA